jgi:hypothetical protein
MCASYVTENQYLQMEDPSSPFSAFCKWGRACHTQSWLEESRGSWACVSSPTWVGAVSSWHIVPAAVGLAGHYRGRRTCLTRLKGRGNLNDERLGEHE